MIGEIFNKIAESTGFSSFDLKQGIMIAIACVLIFLAVVKKYEPMLLLPIAFGMILANLPKTGLLAEAVGDQNGGLIYYLSFGLKKGIYPALIFLGIGAMTDFGPLLSRPIYMIIGAGAQLGIAVIFVLGIAFGFSPEKAASVSIIAGADGPTAIYLTNILHSDSLAAITIAAYSYMALIPIIQPPIMKLLTTKKERAIKMPPVKAVPKYQKICFPIFITVLSILLLPSVAPLLGMLMFGNLLKESGVVERLSNVAQNSLINIITIFLGVSVGAYATSEMFLATDTLIIIFLGLMGFVFSTVGGLLTAKLLNVFAKGTINPLIGSAGVSAVPMAARVAQIEGLKADPQNHLLMHAMGANVSGVIGSAVAAGLLLALFA